MSQLKVQICNNHLADFYDAIKSGDLKRIDILEHELTNSEKCVACAYVFKTRGTVREALETFLNGEGLEVAIEQSENSSISEVKYWGRMAFIFSAVLFGVYYSVMFIKKNVFHILISFGIIEYTIIGILTIIIFVYIDDRFFN